MVGISVVIPFGELFAKCDLIYICTEDLIDDELSVRDKVWLSGRIFSGSVGELTGCVIWVRKYSATDFCYILRRTLTPMCGPRSKPQLQ